MMLMGIVAMTRPTLRQGMDEFFPTKYYYQIMKMLAAKADGQMRYIDMAGSRVAGSDSSHGIKLFRMERQGLIEKKGRGLYQITNYGRKVLRAVDAYKAEMARKP